MSILRAALCSVTLRVGLLGGMVGMAVDIDHPLGLGRALHLPFAVIAVVVGCCALACCAGLLAQVVLSRRRLRVRHDAGNGLEHLVP